MDLTPDSRMVQKGLLQAADIIEAGWCQGTLCLGPNPETGRMLVSKRVRDGVVGVDQFCMAGALAKATFLLSGMPFDLSLYQAMRDQVYTVLPPFHMSAMTSYNDVVCQTASQAAGTLREAADALDG